jgi:hypothetical protein
MSTYPTCQLAPLSPIIKREKEEDDSVADSNGSILFWYGDGI